MAFPIEVNTNNAVRFILNKNGWDQITKYYDGVIPQGIFKYSYKGDDTFELPLWEVMNIFGQSLYNGSTDLPFVDNKITIIKE